MSALHAAFVAAQGDMPELHKDSEAEVQTRSGGKYKYTYLSLETLLGQVLPVLNKHGLALYQAPVDRDGRLGLVSKILHTDGEWLEAWTPLAVDGGASAQAQGSAITYARRYAVLSMLGLAPDEDDDGAKASRNRQGSSERVPGGELIPAEPEPDGQAGLSEGDGTHGEASLLTGVAAAADSSSSESSFKPPATEKPATKGLIDETATILKLLDAAFPEHPGGNGRTWKDVAKEHCRDRFKKESTADLTVAEINELNRWLEEQYNLAAKEEAIPFG